MATTYADLQTALFNEWPFQRFNDSGTMLAIAQKALNDANQAITLSEQWPFRLATATGTSSVTITDLSSTLDIVAVTNTAASNAPVPVLSLEEAQRYYDITLSGFPEAVYISSASATQIVLKAVPIGGALSVTYYKKAPLLSNGTDEPLLPEEWRYLIVTYTAQRLATRKGDTSIQFQAQAELSDGLQQMGEALLDPLRFVPPIGVDG